MTFSDQNVDVGGVDDRRGRGGGLAIGGGGVGVVGLLIYVLVQVLGGGNVDTTQLVPPGGQVQGQGTGESAEELSARCNTEGAIDKYDDCYLIKVYNEINETWAAEFKRRGGDYQQPALGFFEQGVQTGCGQASSAGGPVLLPAGPGDLLRHRVPRTAPGAVRRGGPLRAGLHHGSRGRAPPADAARHRARGARRPAAGTRTSRTSCRSRWSCRPTATPGRGASSRDQRGNVSINEEQLDQAINAAAGGRRRPHPAEDAGPGRPRVVDPRLGRRPQEVVPHGLPGRATSTPATRSTADRTAVGADAAVTGPSRVLNPGSLAR